jgi:hypothetical protein
MNACFNDCMSEHSACQSLTRYGCPLVSTFITLKMCPRCLEVILSSHDVLSPACLEVLLVSTLLYQLPLLMQGLRDSDEHQAASSPCHLGCAFAPRKFSTCNHHSRPVARHIKEGENPWHPGSSLRYPTFPVGLERGDAVCCRLEATWAWVWGWQRAWMGVIP